MLPKLYGAKETNFEHNGIGILVDTISCLVVEEINGMYELELAYKAGSFLSKLLVEDNIIKAKANDEHDPQLFRIYYVSEEINGTITVRAEHISYDLRGNFLESIMLTNVNCQEAGRQMLNNLAEPTNFTFKSDIEHISNYNISRCNGLEAIKGKRGSLVDTFGNGPKLIRDNFNISLVKDRGKNNNVLISYRKNITGYKRELDLTNLVTKIYPYAIVQTEVGTEDNSTTIEELLVLPERFITSENYNLYAKGKILALDYSSEESIKDISSLRSAANKWFSETERDKPNVNYQVEFVNLYKTNNYKNLGLENLENVCLDDTVIIKDYRFDLDVEARVIKTVYNTLAEKYEKIELGKFKDSLKLNDNELEDKVDNSIQQVKNMLVRFEVLDDKIISEVSRLEGDVKANTSLIEQTDSYIQTTVKDLNNKYTSIKQTVDEIDITGLVSFSDLSTKGGTIINGANITTGSITADQLSANSVTSSELAANSVTADHIKAGSISVDMITQSSTNPIIKLFGSTCAIDATKYMNEGIGDSIRFKWNDSNYLKVGYDYFEFYGSSAGTTPGLRFYAGTNTANFVFPAVTMKVTANDILLGSKKASFEGHTHDYAASSHNHSGETLKPYTVAPTNLGDGTTIWMDSALNGNGKNLGYSGSKFYQLSAQYVWGDSGSVSDISTKENIRYLDNNSVKSSFNDVDIIKENKNTLNYDIENLLTKEDLHKFITEEIKLCEYNYIYDDYIDPNPNFVNKIGFIANEYEESKVGSKIIGEHEGKLAYNTNNLLFTIIGALQVETEKRNAQIKNLEFENQRLSSRLFEIEKILEAINNK